MDKKSDVRVVGFPKENYDKEWLDTLNDKQKSVFPKLHIGGISYMIKILSKESAQLYNTNKTSWYYNYGHQKSIGVQQYCTH